MQINKRLALVDPQKLLEPANPVVQSIVKSERNLNARYPHRSRI
jgi:hypothetical protein